MDYDRYGLKLYCEGMEEISIGLILCVCKDIGAQIDWQGDIRQTIDTCAGAVFAWLQQNEGSKDDVAEWFLRSVCGQINAAELTRSTLQKMEHFCAKLQS